MGGFHWIVRREHEEEWSEGGRESVLNWAVMSLPVVQVYTRSVIDPLPAPEGEKNADKLRKKGGKMTDEEIMEKLRM